MSKNRIYRPLCEGLIDILVETFENGTTANKALTQALKSNKQWGARDRKFVADTAYNIIRNWKLYQFAIDSRNIHYWKVLELYFISINSEFPTWWERSITQIELKRWGQGLKDPKIKYGVNDWLFDQGYQALNEKWIDELAAMHQEAEVYLRVNTTKVSVKQCIDSLLKEGVETKPINTECLLLLNRQKYLHTKAYRKGWFETQDLGSQAIVPFLNPAEGSKIIDACAGAGGKALHLADYTKDSAEIVAMDIYKRKLIELKKRASRNGYKSIDTKLISKDTLTAYDSWADYLLLDVPCSGSGTFKRNLDIKWKISKKQFEMILTKQEEILHTYVAMLKKGGELVYATCSILPKENEEQVAKFLKANNGYKLIKEKRVWPSEGGHDGFYMAHIKKAL